MMETIIRGALQNRSRVMIACLVLLILGTWVTSRMAVDVFPDLNAPTVTVVTEAHGMAPEEVEALITLPIESALNGASNVRRVRSSTSVGISVVWVEFDWATDIYAARQIVSEKLQLAVSNFPAEAKRPVLAPISSIMGEILFLALTSEKHSSMELRTLAGSTIRRRLLAVAGVAQVTPIGGEEKQYQVVLDPVRMGAYQLSFRDVVQALEQSNQNVSPGFLVSGGQEYLIQGIGRIRELSDLNEIFITMRNGQPVLVKHVGNVQIGPAVKRGDGSLNGKPAVIIALQKQPGANTIQLTAELDKVLDEVQASLPEGVQVHRHIFRQADFIKIAIHNVVDALRDGTIFVAVVLLLFLASVRATIVTLIAIPLSMITALLALNSIGAAINTMTLGGLAIAIGSLVDDAVIDVENVVRRMRENTQKSAPDKKPILEVILQATLEIRPSIVFATIIIILVFLPLFFLTGVEGRLMRPLGFAFIVSLAASLVVSLIVTPVLCYYLLSKSKTTQEKNEGWLVPRVKAFYEPLLKKAIEAPKRIAAFTIILSAGALVAFMFVGRSFLPEFNEGALTISAVTLPGTSLHESDRLGRMVEEILLSHPEVKAMARRTGRAEEDEHAQGVEASELEVSFNLKKRSKEMFLEDLRRTLSLVPGMNITIGQPISHRIDHMLSGTRANLAVKLFGPDLYELRRIAGNIRAVMQPVRGVVDLSVEQQSDIPALKIKFDHSAMAQFGIHMEDVAENLESVFMGHSVSKVLEGQNAFDLVVKSELQEPLIPENLGNLLLDTYDGKKIPLKLIAKINRDSGPNTISRENVQRKIVIMCNVAGRAVGDVVKDVQSKVKAEVQIPEGYYLEYGGQFEAEQQASKQLLILSFLVVLGMIMVLGFAFKSLRDILFIMLNLPLAVIGGVAGVYLSGGILSIASLIGFITLFGIAVRNGIMLITHIHHLMQKEGVLDFKTAVIRGSMERLSPILMTALCSGLALVPLALSGGKPGSEIQTPMAIVILCGLFSSTVLNMIVVPALYFRFGQSSKNGETF